MYCEYKKTDWFNDEVVKILLDSPTNVRFGNVSVPSQINVIGEYSFPSWAMPYIDTEMLCSETNGLEEFQKMTLSSDTKVDVLGIRSDKPLSLPISDKLYLIEPKDIEDLLKEKRAKFRSNIHIAMRQYWCDLEYRETEFDKTLGLITHWCGFYENNELPRLIELYRLWEKNGCLKVYGVYKDNELVGASYLLSTDKYLCYMLAPWYKTNQDLKEYQLGHYVIVKAIEDMVKNGDKRMFSLGSGNYDYKRRWATSTEPLYHIGLGRWEDRS